MSADAAGGARRLPLDRLFAIYMLLAGVALAFPGRPDGWPLLAAAHAAVIVLAWPLLPSLALPAGARGTARSIADWAPLLLIPLLYKELAVLNRAVFGGTYFDDVVIGWEQAIFGGQPSREWAQALPSLWLSEPLHAAYLSYYLIIFVPPLVLFLRGRTAEFRAGTFALMTAFFAHYLFFIYFPVQGPRYLFPAPGGELASGWFYQLAHRVLEVGSAQGAAFPSSHVGVSVAQTLVVWRYLPKLAPACAALTIGLAVGAVYGGFHYATDAIVGALLGVLAFVLAPRLHALLSRSGEAAR